MSMQVYSRVASVPSYADGASHNSNQMSLDSGSILPHAHATIAETVPESFEEFAHRYDAAAMDAAWAKLCEEDEHMMAHQSSSATPQHVQNNQPSFPTLNNFTAPVTGLPQFPRTDPTQHYYPQPSRTLEGPAWSQPAHVGGASVNGPDSSQDHYPNIVDLELWAAGDPRAYGPQQSTPSGMDHTGYATAANTLLPPAPDYGSMDLTGDSNMEESSPASNETACAPGSDRVLRPRKARPIVESSSRVPHRRKPRSAVQSEDDSSGSPRVLGKRKTCHTVESEDNSSGSAPVPDERQTFQLAVESSGTNSSLPPHKRMCLDEEHEDHDEIKEGKFGAYRLANASAVIMTMPVHDPKPVDIRNRRTRDPYGNLLRTRRFGAMELDDSCSKRSVAIGNGLPTGMTCVQECSWGDQACGLFVETNKVRITHHLFLWHGVKGKTLCKFEDCPKAAMKNLGRHIETVHYTTALECAHCGEQRSRTDALRRHLLSCKPYIAGKASAKKAGRKFSPKEATKLVYGYIVPARDAT